MKNNISLADMSHSPLNADEALAQLLAGNELYQTQNVNPAEITAERLVQIATEGQKPYAVIVTCSDSRVPPEHIFSAGVGDLFVIRTAGNVIGDFELGSIEYGVNHLGASLVVVMGHTCCGAVSAAMSDNHIDGKVASIVDEIKPQIQGITDVNTAIDTNIAHSYEKILSSHIISDMLQKGKIKVIKARYDIHTGVVSII